MNLKQTIATSGLISALAFGSLAFMPASAEQSDALAKAPAAESTTLVALNAPETPQALVWDMEYGDQTPPAQATDESGPEETDGTTDLSLG